MTDGVAWAALPVIAAMPDAEIRGADFAGLTVAQLKLDKGHDTRPAFRGLPDDLCPYPHWGYIIQGRIRLWTRDGPLVYETGDVFYWEPGHAPEAVEDTNYIEMSRSEDYDALMNHLGAGS